MKTPLLRKFLQNPMTGPEIEERSFRIIDEESPGRCGFSRDQWEVVRRLIHTTGDETLAPLVRFSGDAIEAGIGALKRGAAIYADSNMIRSGLSVARLQEVFSGYGRESVSCHVADADVAEGAVREGVPRSLLAIRKAKESLEGGIVVFGNAPVALLELNRMILEEGIRPALVIAMPVGFVHVVESKEELMELGVPFIAVEGRRGGSPLAVAALHAVCSLAARAGSGEVAGSVKVGETGEDKSITAQDRAGFYHVLHTRRDVRSEFTGGEVAEDKLRRILEAAHAAPSVGFMQPWDFVVIRDRQVRANLLAGFDAVRERESMRFAGEKRDAYLRLKLQGIMDCSLCILVTFDPQRHGPVVLGTSAQTDMDRFSCVCAIQNLWLAARAENLGLGWVSLVDPALLRSEIGLPETIEPVALLCIGPVSKFHEKPELEKAGWLPRLALEKVLHEERW